MNNAAQPTGKSFNLGAIRVQQFSIERCERLIAIGKGLPQYCRCSSCAPRGDLGKVVLPK